MLRRVSRVSRRGHLLKERAVCFGWRRVLLRGTVPAMLSPIVVPWPPSSNTYYRSVMMGKSCRVILSKRGREFRQEVIELVRARLDEDDELSATLPLVNRIGVGIMLDPPNRRSFDIDNRIKAVLDALEYAGIYENDSQIDSLTVTRGEVVKGGRAIVNLRWLPSKDEGITHGVRSTGRSRR